MQRQVKIPTLETHEGRPPGNSNCFKGRPPVLTLGGRFGGITQGVLNVAGVDINQKAADALKQAIDPTKLQETLPADIRLLNLSMADASFSALNGQALINLHLSGKVPANQLTLLFQTLLAPKSAKQ
jgi:hypothetical protein